MTICNSKGKSQICFRKTASLIENFFSIGLPQKKFKMTAGIFVFDIIATLALSGVLLFSYGDWMRQKIFVTLSVLVAWYFSFLIIFVLPLDVSSTAYRQCLNQSHTDPIEETTTSNALNVITENEINKTRYAPKEGKIQLF